MIARLPKRCRLKNAAVRLLAAAALCGYALGAAGFPIVRPAKSSAIPFPCQDNPCGCTSAEECYTHCCCHSAEERLAFARRHGVTLPKAWEAALQAQVAAARQDASQAEPEAQPCPCCAKTKANRVEARRTAGRNWAWVIGVSFKKCKGAGPEAGVAFAIPPQGPVAFVQMIESGPVPFPGHEVPCPCHARPPVPPPRAA